MYWNFRLVKHVDEDLSSYYAIHEAYYGTFDDKDDKDDKLEGVTENPVSFISESPEEMVELLEMVLKDIKIDVEKKSHIDYNAYVNECENYDK